MTMTKTHKAPKPGHRLLTAQNAADRLQVSVRTIHRAIATGKLRAIHIGRSVRISEEALQAFLTGEDRA